MNIPPSHPYWSAAKSIKEMDIDFLEFSYYLYQPQTIEDSRKTFQVSFSDFFNLQKIENIFENCPSGHEVAFHSKVITQNEIFHFPFVDMSTPSKANLNRLKNYIGEDFYKSFYWFESGRSFHGYSFLLLTQKDWQEFMGLLLLANPKGMHPLSDPRWIGHRLVAGYSALRWSFNTNQYIKYPKLVS